MRRAHVAASALIALAAACSAPEEPVAPAASQDEQRALSEARAMIPADEIDPTATPQEAPTP